MEPKGEETEEHIPLKTQEEEKEEEEEEEEEEEQEEEDEEEEEEENEEDEEEDAQIFNAWMQQYRGGAQQRRPGGEEEEKEEEEEEEGGRPGSRTSLGHPVRMRTDRRASLPCPATLSSMQLSRLHSSTGAAVTARVLLHRTSSRRLLPSPQESPSPVPPVPVPKPALERRPSLIPTVPTIPEVAPPERRSQFRRRNVMSMSDAYSVCLICHNDLNQGSGTRELQCTHTFHKECIEEWLWRKQSCPTCRVQVSLQQPVYDCVKVP